LSAEDDPADTIRPRLEAVGADLSRIHILQAVRRPKPNGEMTLDHFSLATDLEALQHAATSLEDVRLVLIDPISAYLGATDSHVNSKVRGLLAPLADLAQNLHFSVLTVDHLSKSNRQAIYRPNGSIAFTAAARAVWFFAKNPDDPSQRLMLSGKMNLAPEQTGLSYQLREKDAGSVCVAWGGAVSVSADSVLTPEDSEDRSERLEAMDWLRSELSNGPVSVNQLQEDARAAGYSWRTVRRAQDALGIKPRKDGFKGGWTWQLPEDGHEPPKMSTSNAWTSSPKLATFDSQGYAPDREGPGVTCQTCGSHFGSLGGWRYHFKGRCLPQAEAAD
jgi:hypothetical protein